MKRKLCSKCKSNPRATNNHSYCLQCHAKDMRKWRKTHFLTAEQNRKAICRAYLHVYVKRGKVKKLPCKVCGCRKVQAHHDDYSKPLEVRWLCKKHHQEHHRQTDLK